MKKEQNGKKVERKWKETGKKVERNRKESGKKPAISKDLAVCDMDAAVPLALQVLKHRAADVRVQQQVHADETNDK